MPAKRGKSGKGKDTPGAPAANRSWASGLTTAQFEEDSWKACVSVVVGESPEDEDLIGALGQAIQQPLRKLFSFVSWEGTLAKIQELGNPKAKKPKDVPVFYEVTEPAKALLDAGEEIPSELMAKILKFELLEIKASDQQRRRAEQAAATEEKAKGKAGPASDTKDKGGAKAKTAAAGLASMEKEKETKLKRRGYLEPPTFIDDEPDDGPQHYILIGGFHQPQLLSALDAVGVHVANVIMLGSEGTQSSKCGEVPLSEELARRAWQLESFWSGLGPVLDSGPPASKLHDVARLSHTVPDPVRPVLTQDPQEMLALGSRIFEGVACLIYDCLDWRRQHQHYRDNTTLINIPAVVRMEPLPTESDHVPLPMTVGCKGKSLREDSLPATTQEMEAPPLTTDVDMRYYNDLLDRIPPEACSVPLILHCMLEQVEFTVQQSSPPPSQATTDPRPAGPESTADPRPAVPESTADPRLAGPESTADPRPAGPGPGRDQELISYMLHSFLPLVHTQEEKSQIFDNLLMLIDNEQDRKMLVEEFRGELQNETEKTETERPLVYKHHDERALRLRQTTACQGFDPVEAEAAMMKLSPVWELICSAAPQSTSAPRRMSLTQQLLRFCTDDGVPCSEVERVLRQSVLESMPLTGPDQQGLLLNATRSQGTTPASGKKLQPLIIPWDDPVSYAKQQLHYKRTKEGKQSQTFLTEGPGSQEQADRSACTQLELSEIQRNRLRHLSDWHYAEHHNATVFPQVLQAASQAYRCMDTFRSSHDNILYVICHHPMSPQRQCKESWDVALHTDVGFRKYLEHVADSISDWTREEEVRREAEQLRNLNTPESPQGDAPTDSGTEPDTPEPFIRKDSLKAWKLEQDRLREEEMVKKYKKDNPGGGKALKGKDERAGSTKNKKDDKKDEKTDEKKDDKKDDKKHDKKALSGRRKSREDIGSSAKSPIESTTITAPPMEETGELQPAAEPSRGFIGYSMDGKLIQVSGQLQYLFPSDGGQVTLETISFIHGSKLMKVCVRKDGHHFYTHISHVIVEPLKGHRKADDRETKDSKDVKDSTQDPNKDRPASTEKTVRQGSFSAVLDNGVRLSYSYYGPTGQYTGTTGASHLSSPVPVPPSSHSSQSPGQVSSPVTQTQDQTLDPVSQTKPAQSQVQDSQSAVLPSCHPFNSLNLCVPNGLLLQFLSEDTQGVVSEEPGVLVRQSFPLHGVGAAGGLPDPSLSRELSRVITSNGTVFKYMRDGSSEVLFADGAVSSSPDSGPVWVPDSEIEEDRSPTPEPKDTTDNKKGKCSSKEAETESVPTPQRGIWVTTAPSGFRVATVGNTHKRIPIDPVLTFHATDPLTKAVMVTREDQVVSVQESDGGLTVEHADGTRITTRYRERALSRTNSLIQTGERHQSEGIKSTSQCMSERTESECDSHHAQSTCSELHAPSVCENGRRGVCGEESVASVCDGEAGSSGVCNHESVCETGRGSVSAQESVCETGRGSVSAQESVCETGRGSVSAQESVCEKAGVCSMESVCAKERVVLVEREGCATVVMYPEQNTAHVFLADDTVVVATGHGAYQVFPSGVGLLQIHRDGTCVYSSDPGRTPSPTVTSEPTLSPSPEGGASRSQPGSYVMSHTAEVACEVTDPDGNHFQVMRDGKTSVVISSPAENTWDQEEEEEREREEEDGEMAWLHVKHREHCPRLFLIHEDGSGTELLNSQTAEDLLNQAYSDPAVAVQREPLPDTHGVFGITILKPCHQSEWSRWLLGKQQPDITPANLKNRSWHDFPSVEMKTPGPLFGSDLGVGLTLRERPSSSPAHHRPVLSCPEALELRELVQYRPVTSQLRTTLDTRLKEYMECLLRREELSEEVKVKDPRTEEERVHASDLLKLLLSLPECESPAQTFDKRTSVDMASLYNQAVNAPALQSEASEDTLRGTTDSSSNEKDSKWPGRIAQYRQELKEEKACREALRNKIVVPYFHPENTQLYQNLPTYQAPDMRSLSSDLPPFPKTADGEAALKDAPRETTQRPLNPTPSHAAGSDAMPVGRPTNPTPQTAGEISLGWSPGLSKSVQLDVTGNPRKTRVKLPASILSSKPDSIPNQQFLSVEEPVRRKCRTISLTGPNPVVRGFHLLPSSVDFGTLKEGSSYAVTVVMKNVGVDTCRFSVKQPPPATGLRVLYNPRPVPAGLQAELQVQLFAMSVVQEEGAEPKNYISQYIHIHTETDILFLSVTATVLPENAYDVWVKDRTKRQNMAGSKVHLLSSTPPVRRGVVLPHKQTHL